MSHNSFSSPATSGPGRPGGGNITLTQPRPGAARRQNDYLDSPLRPPPPLPTSSPPLLLLPSLHGLPVIQAPKKGAMLKPPPRMPGSMLCTSSSSSSSIGDDSKEQKSGLMRGVGGGGGVGGLECSADPCKKQPVNLNESTTTTSSIVCRECNKCRCEACQQPKALPSRWVCGDKFHCSAHNLLEHATCLCCAKGVFYHWAKDTDLDSDVSCADKPCSCGPQHFWARWGCLAVMSAVLPCLCCYPPLKMCVNACESAYGRWTSRCGCHCKEYKDKPNKLLSSTT
ncbi:protein sprouty-like [Tropilaelaps mercedesae]|uniref:Protein sprouty-like n=1 Tax=Tropilaelaps mercedesae TaxID=418985 RepID=A0A1V9Y1W7_9ACAR|nr:protein sprouty-like [Tropilaelaps mercedesae]